MHVTSMSHVSNPHNQCYLNIDGPLHAPREAEGVASDGVLHIAQDEEVKEEPAHSLYQLVVALPLLVIH